MLKLVHVGNALPIDFPVDPNAEFEAGQIGQLGLLGNNIVLGVSDGTAPIGIIDDMKTSAFSAPVIDEVVIKEAPGIEQNGVLVSAMDVMATLDNPNIISTSFVTDPVKVELNPRNGVVVFPKGTELNFDGDGDGTPDSIRTVVSYSYQVPNIPGDDSTAASGKVTIWYQAIFAQTDRFETNQRYELNAPLFVSESGLLTTRQPSPDHFAPAIVTGPPTAFNNFLEFQWL